MESWRGVGRGFGWFGGCGEGMGVVVGFWCLQRVVRFLIYIYSSLVGYISDN